MTSIIRNISGHPIRWLIGFNVVISALFLAFPHLDIAFSSLFYKPDMGFIAHHMAYIKDVRRLGFYVIGVVAALSVLTILLKILLPGRKPLIRLRSAVFMASSLIIGPGLIVNTLLKNNWGRPRPSHILEFGGNAPYVDVWQISNWCDTNCSFVSGEAASAIWLLCLVFIVPRKWRAVTFVVTSILCIAFSAIRLLYGGHFLSDTLLAWGLVGLTMAVIYRYLFLQVPNWLTEDALDNFFTGIGRKLQGLFQRKKNTSERDPS